MDGCETCGFPFLTSMRNSKTGQWAAQCGACGHVVMLTEPERTAAPGPEPARPATTTEQGDDRAVLTHVLAMLEAMEWLPERNMRGGTTNFCPVCHGTPGVYVQNKKAARPDGHWLVGIGLPPHGCPLAAVLDVVRAALPAAAAQPGPAGEGA